MAYQVSRVLWASRKSPHQSGPYSACPEELLPVWRESWWRELCSHSCPPHKKVLFTAQDCRTAQELCPMKGALLCRSRIQAGCSVKGNSYQLCAPCLLITSSHTNHRLLICNCWLTQGGLNKGLIIVCFVPTKNAPPPSSLCCHGNTHWLFDRCYAGRLSRWLSWAELMRAGQDECFSERQEVRQQIFLLRVTTDEERQMPFSRRQRHCWRDGGFLGSLLRAEKPGDSCKKDENYFSF